MHTPLYETYFEKICTLIGMGEDEVLAHLPHCPGDISLSEDCHFLLAVEK